MRCHMRDYEFEFFDLINMGQLALLNNGLSLSEKSGIEFMRQFIKKACKQIPKGSQIYQYAAEQLNINKKTFPQKLQKEKARFEQAAKTQLQCKTLNLLARFDALMEQLDKSGVLTKMVTQDVVLMPEDQKRYFKSGLVCISEYEYNLIKAGGAELPVVDIDVQTAAQFKHIVDLFITYGFDCQHLKYHRQQTRYKFELKLLQNRISEQLINIGRILHTHKSLPESLQ